MKVQLVLFAMATLASASFAFVVTPSSTTRSTAFLAKSKEEDMELTRKVIHDFEEKLSGETPAEEEAPPKSEEPVAASSEE